MKLSRFFAKEEFRPSQLPLLKEKRRARDRRSKTENKRTVLVLFIATLFLSSLFWFWGVLLEKKEEPLKVLTTEAGPTPTRSEEVKREVIARVRQETQSLRGEYGFYVYNLVSRYQYGVREKEVFTAASLIKLPVILALYQEEEAGRINLEDEYKLKEEDKLEGTGSLKSKPAGTTITYRQLAYLMCKQSDNTAFGIVRKKLGDEKISQTIEALGMERTSLARNETSPYDIGLFWRKLYAGGIISRGLRDKIIEALTETAFEDRIPAGVPEGVKVSHKIGNEEGSYSDAGIIFSSRPFVLVVMSENASREEADRMMVEATKIIFEEETR